VDAAFHRRPETAVSQPHPSEVWVTALVHLAIAGGIARCWPILSSACRGRGWMLGASFGFSSTVLTAIILEPRRELRAFHGRVAIGILIVQDLVAVALLAFGNQVSPSPYALFLLLLR